MLPRLLPLALSLSLLAACDSGNPVAPAPPEGPGGGNGGGGGAAFDVTLNAAPAQLLAGGGEPSTLTVTARRQGDGQAPADGTQAVLTSDMGSLGVDDPASPVRSATLALTGGRAQISFFAGEAVGTATLLAQVGQSVGRAEVEIAETLPNTFFLTGINPGQGTSEGGEVVTLQGAGFVEPLRVTFGGALGRVVNVPSGNAILVETPAAPAPVEAGSTLLVDVAVTNDLTDPMPRTDTLAGAFTYRADPLPPPPPPPPPFFVSGIDPASGSPAGGEPVRILGGGFREPLRVEIGGRTAQVNLVFTNQVAVTTPEAPAEVAPGTTLAVDVTVTNALTDEAPAVATLPGAFLYDGGPVPEPVVVTALAPPEGPAAGGTVVTVTGEGFEAPVGVELAGVRQRDETVVSSTEVRFTTAGVNVAACPAGGGLPQAGLTVTNLGSGVAGSAALVFTYRVSLPRVSRISPTAGPQLGNSLVTVEGEGFEAPARVVFARGGEAFAGVIQGEVEPTRILVSSPRVPDTLFPEVDCVTNDSEAGKRFVPVTVDVEVTHLATGCQDVLPNAFTYQPTFAGCRVVTPP